MRNYFFPFVINIGHIFLAKKTPLQATSTTKSTYQLGGDTKRQTLCIFFFLGMVFPLRVG
jgi:hypothetical protein